MSLDLYVMKNMTFLRASLYLDKIDIHVMPSERIHRIKLKQEQWYFDNEVVALNTKYQDSIWYSIEDMEYIEVASCAAVAHIQSKRLQLFQTRQVSVKC